MGQSIHAVTLLVPDYDAGIDFYVKVLGFQLVEDTPLTPSKRWVLVRPEGGETNLLLAKAANSKQESVIGGQTGGRVGFFLKTSEFDQDVAKYVSAGVNFLEEPRHEPYGSVAVFEDPFGNKWDLLQLKS